MRFHLRHQTAASHAALDAAVGHFNSARGYARYCRGLLNFRAPLERAIAAVMPIHLDDWNVLPLADALRSDLRDLGEIDGDAESGSNLKLLDFHRLLGALYVLEGSSLGARILLERAAALGLSEQHGARHLDLQTRDRTRWARFVAILEKCGHDHPERIANGAENAFAHALKSFDVADDDN